MVYIAMYKGKGSFYDSLIRFTTNSQYSHCEVVVAGTCYSSSPRDGGVRSKVIDLNDGKWDVFPVPHATPVNVLQWFVSNVGKKYDWFGAITQVLPIDLAKNDKYFCSEACAQMLRVHYRRPLQPQTLLAAVK